MVLKDKKILVVLIILTSPPLASGLDNFISYKYYIDKIKTKLNNK